MRIYLGLLSVCLAACTTMGSETAGAKRCDASKVQTFIGREADGTLTDVQKRSGAQTVRKYVTGSPLTMDYREDRLNIEVDPANHIVKLSCG